MKQLKALALSCIFSISAVPDSEAVLLHAAEGLSSGTIKCGVWHSQLSFGLGDAKRDMATLQHVVGNKECSSKDGSATKAKIAYYSHYIVWATASVGEVTA